MTTMKQLLQVDHKDYNSMYDGYYTKTAQFLIPAISIDIKHPLVDKFFLNAYLSDFEHKHQYTRPIFMLFAFDNKNIEWKKLYSTLIKSNNFLTEYDVGYKNEKQLLMIVFTVPEKYAEEYKNFRLSKYSLFSDEYKAKFPEYINNSKNIIWQIVHKDEELVEKVKTALNVDISKDMEIWDRVENKREIYRLKQ